jgi:HicB_like antitoxin of bacterial toxin-antitoxin system
VVRVDFSGIASGYNIDMAKAQKVMVSFPDDLLERIDREADERGTTRSGFLQEAARRELGWPDPAAIDAALARGRAALAGLGSFEAADLIRDEREGRDERDRHR